MFFCLPGYPADQYDFTIFACFWLCVPSREEKGGCVCDSLSRRVFVPFPDQSVQFPTVFSVLLHYDAGAVCFIDRERKVDRHEEKLSVSSDWRNDCLFRFPDISADYSGSAADFYLVLDGNCLPEKQRSSWKNLFLHTLSWGIGYVGMWSSKWVIASVLTGENIIYDAFSQIAYRSGYFTEKHSYYDTLKLNLGVCNTKVILPALICVAACIVIFRIKSVLWQIENGSPLWGQFCLCHYTRFSGIYLPKTIPAVTPTLHGGN